MRVELRNNRTAGTDTNNSAVHVFTLLLELNLYM